MVLQSSNADSVAPAAACRGSGASLGRVVWVEHLLASGECTGQTGEASRASSRASQAQTVTQRALNKATTGVAGAGADQVVAVSRLGVPEANDNPGKAVQEPGWRAVQSRVSRLDGVHPQELAVVDTAAEQASDGLAPTRHTLYLCDDQAFWAGCNTQDIGVVAGPGITWGRRLQCRS
jgi:hypothetical protein